MRRITHFERKSTLRCIVVITNLIGCIVIDLNVSSLLLTSWDFLTTTSKHRGRPGANQHSILIIARQRLSIERMSSVLAASRLIDNIMFRNY